jgi:replicative DNA helicase
MADGELGAGIPPHDLAAEKAVLRAMLRSPEAVVDVVDILTEHDFYRPSHALIYTAALAVYSREEDPDPINVGAELAKQDQLAAVGGTLYLHNLAGEPAPPGSWTANAERVQAMAVLRRTQVAVAHIENLVAEGQADDVDQFIDVAQAEIYAATLRDRSRIPPDRLLGDVLEGALDEIEAIGSPNGSGPTGIKTGFTDLDALTGGLYPGQLIVIAGRAAMGTTTLTLDILRSTALQQGLPAALFSLEMRSLDLTMRVMSAEARIALHHMRSGAMTDDDWMRLSRRMPDISAAPLFLQDDDYGSFSDLRAHARRLHARHGVRLIAVDDLQHLPYGTRRLASRYEEVSEIARGLKRMAKELQIPVIAVSTLNRGPEQRPDKRPLLNDLRDSGALEDNADLVILIHREDAYQRDTPRAGEADLIVAKHREGPVATVTVIHQGHYARFADYPR